MSPITVDEMSKNGKEVQHAERGHNIVAIEKFLRSPKNVGKAFTQKEIATAVGCRGPAARSALLSIEKKTSGKKVPLVRREVEVGGKKLIHYGFMNTKA